MEIVGLYRYPGKSAQGEALDSAAIGQHGINGDRSHALVDVETGVALTGRLDPSLLFATGMLTDGRASLLLPDGTVTADDVVISAWIGRPVHHDNVQGEASPCPTQLGGRSR
ncbi:MAG: MOSC domain-containing protein [Actinomycetota bacterium]|nr:MOSC domain-containing protein [Actinomycetota bacterium]